MGLWHWVIVRERDRVESNGQINRNKFQQTEQERERERDSVWRRSTLWDLPRKFIGTVTKTFAYTLTEMKANAMKIDKLWDKRLCICGSISLALLINIIYLNNHCARFHTGLTVNWMRQRVWDCESETSEKLNMRSTIICMYTYQYTPNDSDMQHVLKIHTMQ